MKRFTVILTAFLMVFALSTAFAAQEAKAKKAESKTAETKEAPKSATISGEIVDMGCYMAEGAKGEAHKSCASMCISSGMPMGLLTKEGKLYLLTMNHDKADPFNAAKKMAAEEVSVTGTLSERNGMKSISVDDVKEMTTAKTE